jgi:hypothetical protein
MDITKGGTVSGATTVAASLASVERDRTVYNLPTHSAKEPRVVIFNRQLPGGGDKEVLRTGIRVVMGDRNTDGTARSGNVIVEASIRIPQDQEVAIATEALDMLVGILRDDSIMDTNLSAGQIPFEA